MRHRRPPPYDPLAPRTPRQQRRDAVRDERAGVKALAGMINKRASASAQNISGVYGKLAGDLGGYRATEQDIYDRARANVGGNVQAGAQQLQQTSGEVGAALQKNLALSGPTGVDTSGYGGDVTRLTSGQQSRGSAVLGELALRQASAENYASKLPQFARLAGGQALQESEAGRRRDVADLTSKAQAQLADSLDRAHRLEYEKAVAARGFGVDYSKIDASLRTASALEAGRNRRNTQSVTSRESIATANRRAQRARAILAEGGKNRRARASAARQGRSLDEQQSAQRGVLVDKRGKVIKNYKGKPIPYRPGKHVGGKKAGGGSGSKLK